ncbi:MAG: amino acid ABC transporter permease [Bacillota bacterium]
MAEFWTDFQADFYLNFIKDDRWKFLTNGLKVTLQLTFASVLIGIIIGIVVAMIRSSHDKVAHEMRPGIWKNLLILLNGLCKIYLTVLRGTPVVVQILLMYFVILISVDSKLMVGIITFGINSGAYVAEIVRSGIMSIDVGQFEAGRSLGFTYTQTMRHIILPQAFKTVLPSLASEFIVLLKETSIVGYIALEDLTKGGDIIRSRTYSAFMPLIAVALIYLVMVTFFTMLVGQLERRLKNSER